MAYTIVSNLNKLGKQRLLHRLAEGVQENERKKSKKHQVFRLSFDGRKCFNEQMLVQKLNYIHHNPVKGKWSLVDDFVHYPHSSAAYYELGEQNDYVTHYREVGNV